MKTFVFNKLVRDNVVPIMQHQDCVFEVQKLTKGELLEALHAKAQEEIDEIEALTDDTTIDHIIEEIADLREVIEAIHEEGAEVVSTALYQKTVNEVIHKYHIELKEVLDVQNKKRHKKGKFAGGNYIGEVTMDETNLSKDGQIRYDYFMEKYESK